MSAPPGKAERQGVGTLATVASDDSTVLPSVNDQYDDGTRRLADFSAGLQLGTAIGRARGFDQGYGLAQSDQDLVRGLISAHLAATKPFAKIKAARNAPIKLCGSLACNPIPKCSACVHVYAVLRRGGDYMGAMAVHSKPTR